MNVIISYWTQNLNPAIAISVGLVLLGAINLWSVRWFGEAEFWISITKVFLILGLMFYTVITMLGGYVLCPKGDLAWSSFTAIHSMTVMVSGTGRRPGPSPESAVRRMSSAAYLTRSAGQRLRELLFELSQVAC